MRIIDVIDHTNVMPDEFTYREPQSGGGDWRMGSQVIVNESQMAVFVRAGKALDGLNPGRHTLSVANLPILSGLIGMATSGRTPFTADVYFINLKDMPQIGWGTNPGIPLETPGKGMGAVLLKTYGTLSISISDPHRFLLKFGVGQAISRVGDIKNSLQTKLMGDLTELLMKSGVDSIPKANGLISDIEGGVLVKLSASFEEEFGIRINSFDANPFTAQAIPIDELMNYVDLEMYERVKRMQIAETAAGNEGMGGAMVGLGVGAGVGQNIGGMMNPGANQAAEMQQQMMQQQMQQQQQMMQQMMMMMNQNQGGQQPVQQQAPPPPAAPASSGAPTSREEIQGAIDALELRLMNGEISESIFERLTAKWQAKLDALG
jgi:membrane protease subunit (stomatin/prohibitin family)